MKRIVLFKGGVETLGYFSQQLQKAFNTLGHKTYMFDYDKEAASSYNLLKFYEKDNTVMLTFNFHGICNENILRDENNVYIWDALNIPCINIVVDHPFYYDRFMPQLPALYTQISIDKNHLKYMQRFYPEIKNGPFIPLAGTCLDDIYGPALPINERPIDVIFTGSWAEPEFWGKFMTQEGPEYEAFYRELLKEQIEHPDCTFEEIFEPAILSQAEDAQTITDLDLRNAYSHMIHFDMYVRYYFRGEFIKTLADNGVKVLCIGGGWDKLNCLHPENITHISYTDSLTCLKYIRDSKISINVMPWFKNGAHDRIFNSMLAHSLCITDSSEYLDQILIDGENCLLFSLQNMKEAADKIKNALQDNYLLQSIADNGYKLALKHSWESRAQELHTFIEDMKI